MANPRNDPLRSGDTQSSEANEPQTCAQCGHQVSEDSRFCPGCGARVPLLKNHEIFDGKYEIVRLLSQGPATEMYEARHLELGEARNIKILRPELFLEENHKLRFRREAKLASRVRHANVTELYDFVAMKDGGYYMVGEHLDGKTLREWHDGGNAADARAVVDVGIQVLNGLAAIHDAGIVHRDISPETIVITEGAGATREGSTFRAKIADLGIAKGLDPAADDAATEVGRFMGNVQYSSPEQAGMSDEQLDGRSDLYSLGVTLYEMLAGELPFRALTPQGYLVRHVSEAPPSLLEAAPEQNYPATLDAVIARSIQKDRDARYQTVGEFREALLEARKDLMASGSHPLPSRQESTEARKPAASAASPIPFTKVRSDADAASPAPPAKSNEESVATPTTVTEPPEPVVPDTDQIPAAQDSVAPVLFPVLPSPESASHERAGFETATLTSSPATRDISANNTYDPLARKKINWGTWLPLLVLGALIFWGVWLMARPAPEEGTGTLAITATSSQTDTAAPAASETAPVAPLPPNIVDPVNGLGAGDGSILQEIPANSADLTSQPGGLPSTTATTPAAGETRGPGAQVSERDAINIIVTGVNRTDYYGVEAGCLGVGSSRFVNGGYTIELITRSCPGRSPGALLGRWRVDGRTGDAYVQNAQGKYVSP